MLIMLYIYTFIKNATTLMFVFNCLVVFTTTEVIYYKIPKENQFLNVSPVTFRAFE